MRFTYHNRPSPFCWRRLRAEAQSWIRPAWTTGPNRHLCLYYVSIRRALPSKKNYCKRFETYFSFFTLSFFCHINVLYMAYRRPLTMILLRSSSLSILATLKIVCSARNTKTQNPGTFSRLRPFDQESGVDEEPLRG